MIVAEKRINPNDLDALSLDELSLDELYLENCPLLW